MSWQEWLLRAAVLFPWVPCAALVARAWRAPERARAAVVETERSDL